MAKKLSNVRGRSDGDVDTTVRQLLAKVSFDRAAGVPLRRALARGKAGAVVALVPSPQWVAQVANVIDDFHDDIHVITRTGDKKDADENVTASRKLAAGITVAAVTPSERFLPSIFKSVTQHSVVLGPVKPSVVASVIHKVSVGRVPASFRTVNVGVLDFDELAGLIVAGADAKATAARIAGAVERKTSMSRKGEALPRLEDATEFGAAQAWALDLAQDVRDLRAGTIGWEDVDKGAVIYGPPGTGKTFFARVLGEATGLPVVIASMGDFFAGGAGYLDSVLKAQRAAFEQAKTSAPSILFLDEIDALPDLDQISPRGRDWWSPIVADFLQLLDGATSDRSGVIVIGATNRIHAIAPAVLRPGRLERSIYMGPPDGDGIVRVFRHHLEGALAGEDLGELGAACASRGLTSAQVMELVRTARRTSRRAKRPMLLQDLVDTVIPPDHRTIEDRHLVAVHEAGHALVGYMLMPGKLLSVSIQPLAGTGGHVQFQDFDKYIANASALEHRVATLLAGRASEIVVYGCASSGAGGTEDSDLARATALVAAGSLSYGLGKSPRWRCEPNMVMEMLNLERDTRKDIEVELARISEEVLEILQQNRGALDTIVDALLDRGILHAEEVGKIIRSFGAPVSATSVAA